MTVRGLVRHALGAALPHGAWGACRECNRPWWAVRQHALVYFTATASAFALCMPCWTALSPLRRFEAFSRLVDDWERCDEDFPRTTPRDPDIATIRARFARAILVERDPLHFRSPALGGSTRGAPPPEFRGRH